MLNPSRSPVRRRQMRAEMRRVWIPRAAAVRQPASIAAVESRHAAAVRFSWLEDRLDPAGIGGPNSCGSRSIETAAAADAKRERVGWVGKGRGLSVSDTTCYTPGRRRSPGRERTR